MAPQLQCRISTSLTGVTAAFDDFSYHIYLFPHALTPEDRQKGTHVWFTPMWRGTDYLVYSVFDYPSFRWTSTHSIEIDLNETSYTRFTVEPVKSFEPT